jgi:hypothetical protein
MSCDTLRFSLLELNTDDVAGERGDGCEGHLGGGGRGGQGQVRHHPDIRRDHAHARRKVTEAGVLVRKIESANPV